MKKSLVALAVLAATGAASAQSSVTLYGVADAWLGNVKSTLIDGGAESSLSQSKLDSGGISGSRWGIKGSEDLGGGLKANFVLESGIALDTGVSRGFNRVSTLGLSGGFGAVTLGNDYSPYDDFRAGLNNTFDSSFTSSLFLGYSGSPKNQIKYVSPSFGGFSAALGYAFGEDKTATASAGGVTSLNAQYGAGPLVVGFAHQTEKAGATFGLGVFDTVNSALTDAGLTTIAAPAGTKAQYNLIGASYDLGVAKLLGSFNTVKFTAPGVAGDVKSNEFQFGADIPLSSATTLALGYSQSKAKDTGAEIYKTTAFSGAVMYSLSKRTSAYAGFNSTKLEFDALNVGDVTLKSTLYAVGVKHTF